MTNEMTAFHGKQELKDELLALGEHHKQADMLLKGTYGVGEGERFKGCTIGCYSPCGLHAALSEKYGISLRILYLADRLFEGLQNPENTDWHTQWVAAIPVGMTKQKQIEISDRLLLWTLKNLPETSSQNVIDPVIALYERKLSGDTPTPEEWTAAADAAAAAAAARWSSAAAAAAARWSSAAAAARWSSDADAAATAAAAAAREKYYRDLRDEYFNTIAGVENATR